MSRPRRTTHLLLKTFLSCVLLIHVPAHCYKLGSTSEQPEQKPRACGVCLCRPSVNGNGVFANCSSRSLKYFPNLPNNLIELDLSHNSLTRDSFQNISLCNSLPFLRIASLSWNKIDLDDTHNMFHGCGGLLELDIKENLLQLVTNDTFRNLDSLEKISLSAKTIGTKAFEPLGMLKDITYLKAKTFSSSAFEGLKLMSLNLIYKDYVIDKNLLRGLEDLDMLTLSLPRIHDFPLDMLRLPRLQTLKLIGPKIHKMSSSALSGLPRLTSLSLDLPSLVEFKLNKEDKPYELKELEIHNIRGIDSDILNGLELLKNLSLQGLRKAPDGISFDESPSLKSLKIVDCSLRELPDRWFHILGTLRSLDLTNNGLQYVEASAFDGLNALEDLNLAQNKISDLPEKVFAPVATNLRILIMRENQLSHIKYHVFSHLSQLQVLDLRSNDLEFIHPEAFEGMPNVYNLNLHHNALSALDATLFDDLHALVHLDLSGNRLTEFPQAVFLTSLQSINLKENAIRVLPGSALCKMGTLYDLSVEDNPIECDCGVMDFVQCMKEKHGSIRGLCYQPDSFNGLNIDQMSECMETTISSVSTDPSTVSENPSTVSANPSTTSAEPSKVSANPSTTSAKPSKVSADPIKISENPGTVSGNPSIVFANPRTATAYPSMVFANPSTATTYPNTVSANPSTTSSKPSKVSAIPSSTMEASNHYAANLPTSMESTKPNGLVDVSNWKKTPKEIYRGIVAQGHLENKTIFPLHHDNESTKRGLVSVQKYPEESELLHGLDPDFKKNLDGTEQKNQSDFSTNNENALKDSAIVSGEIQSQNVKPMLANATWSNETFYANSSNNKTRQVPESNFENKGDALNTLELQKAELRMESSSAIIFATILPLIFLITMVVGIVLYVRNRHTGSYDAIEGPQVNSASIVDLEMDTVPNSFLSEGVPFHASKPAQNEVEADE